MDRHKIASRLVAVEDETVIFASPAEQDAIIQGIDTQFVEIQHNGEKKCRKIIKPPMNFSEPVKVWEHKVQAYRDLIRLKKNKSK